MGDLWRAYVGLNKVAYSAADRLSRTLARSVGTAQIRPSRAAFQTGILCPGDGPPSSATNSFLDYREILLPDQLRTLVSGTFPLGSVKHPRASHGAFGISLNWEHVRRHVAVIGPSGSGKTSNLLAPWAATAAASGISVVAVDTKGDFVQEIADYKIRGGITKKLPLIRWDIHRPTESRPWNLLGEVSSVDDAAQVALAFLGAVDPNDKNKSFAERDHRWLRGLVNLLVSVHRHNAHPQDLYALVVNQQALVSLVQQAPAAAGDLYDLVQFPSSEYSKATWGLANKLSWLAEPQLSTMLSGKGPRAFTLREAVASGAILIVGARVSGGEKAMTAASLILNMLKLRCMEGFVHTPRPMFWILDEAPKYAARIELDQVLDLMRGAGVAVCVGVQDVTQLGDENTQTRMLSNADTVITLKGISAKSAEYLASRLGDVEASSASMQMDPNGRWIPSLAHSSRPMLGSREIMQPPVGQYGGIVHVRGSSPHPFLVTFDA
jgi:type IV secretory pathway TraG/TraD family ATPase VirD4